MQIVIDIPEKDYDDILNGETKASALNWSTFNAIRNGTPLPEEQGMKKYQNRKEQRNVTETMNALLLPLLSYLTSDTGIIVRRALYLLGEIEVESVSEEGEGGDSGKHV